MGYVSREQICRARRTDLYDYLVRHHADSFKKEGCTIRSKEHSSLIIRKGHSGYVRYSNNETGNAIDFLMAYMWYSFVDAVSALTEGEGSPGSAGCVSAAPSYPEPASASGLPQKGEPPYTRAYAYLTRTRHLAPDVVKKLIRGGLLYQDVPYGNAVFVNHERSYYEARGTLSDVRYHRSLRISREGPPCWWFMAGEGSIRSIYICEGAIDAVSLYELHCLKGMLSAPAIYCSIGGAGNQRSIEYIGHACHADVILAVDNDHAGELCRRRNQHLRCLIPELKDWNDDLVDIKR